MRSPWLALALSAAALLPAGAVAGDEGQVVELRGYVHRYRPGLAVGGETDPLGWVLSPDRVNREIVLPRICYLESAAGSGVDLSSLAGRFVAVSGRLERDALSAGGVETRHRTFDLLHVERATAEVSARRTARLAHHLRLDLALRRADFDRNGTTVPDGRLTPEGTCPDGTPALRIPIEVPPPGSADMYTVTAFLCRGLPDYWVLREGGFVGEPRWLGPFPLPDRAARRDLRLAARLRSWLERRGFDFDRDGTPTPEGGLSADGTCPEGDPARRVPLVRPPQDSADEYSVTAHVCRHARTWWAVREGGFWGRQHWIGPFDLRQAKRKRR